jgi:hypothetical protein
VGVVVYGMRRKLFRPLGAFYFFFFLFSSDKKEQKDER